MACHFLLWEIFLTPRSNAHLLHWQADSLLLSHLEVPIYIYMYIYTLIFKYVYICSCFLGFTFHTSRSGLIELVYVLIIPWIFLSRTHLSARLEFHEGKGLYSIYLCTHGRLCLAHRRCSIKYWFELNFKDSSLKERGLSRWV